MNRREQNRRDAQRHKWTHQQPEGYSNHEKRRRLTAMIKHRERIRALHVAYYEAKKDAANQLVWDEATQTHKRVGWRKAERLCRRPNIKIPPRIISP
jgi:hypothetical protein